jgi:dihydropteroate synthase
MLSIVVKQEMLAAGGDAAIPKDALFSGFDDTDIIILGSRAQISKLISKLRIMRFESLRSRGLPDAADVANVLEELISIDKR